MPVRVASGNVGHASTTVAKSGSIGAESAESAPHFAPLSAGTSVFPAFSEGVRVPPSPLRLETPFVTALEIRSYERRSAFVPVTGTNTGTNPAAGCPCGDYRRGGGGRQGHDRRRPDHLGHGSHPLPVRVADAGVKVLEQVTLSGLGRPCSLASGSVNLICCILAAASLRPKWR